MKILTLFILSLFTVQQAQSSSHDIIHLWPENVPEEHEAKALPTVSDKTQGNTIRINKVTDPALVVYEADSASRNGAAVIICPGGGYGILAIDKEGYEIADWLSNLGYTAFVLQYRVPNKKAGALQDALRAIRCVRGMHEKWNIKTDKIGVLGFSAGGSLSARASTRYTENLYDPVDRFDTLSARPDFAVLIYPAYLDQGPNHSLTPELNLGAETPPMFMFQAADDKYANSSLVMSSALRRAKLPFELHIVAHGGHGFGMRKGNYAAETWPKLCEKWLRHTVFGQNGKQNKKRDSL